MSFWTYMLRCADESYYVGHTDDLERRIGEHRTGTIGGYTASRRPVELVWSQEFATRGDVLASERQVKGWSGKKKQALIDGDWNEIARLAWGTRNPLPEKSRQLGRTVPPARDIGADTGQRKAVS